MALRSRLLTSLGLALLGAGPASLLAQADSKIDPAAIEFFEKKVRPLLVDNCYNCHSANTNAKGGLRVDDRLGMIHGGNSGSGIVPGDPENSLLIQAVRYTDENLRMPPRKRLTAEQVAILERWIKEGAAWPAVRGPATAAKPNPKYDALRQTHWAWQPLKDVKPPLVRNSTWPSVDIDRFVLAKLEEKGLEPVADADKLTLIRRVTFDLTGLPPTLDAIDAFLADESTAAFEKVVDRLLTSPAFGERWGRHWLDVARYGESTGSSRNVPLPHAWRYRDYVINALATDKPFDRFIREQVAGDLLRAESPAERESQLIATGFLALGVKDVNQRFKVRFIMDNVDEQIDTVSRSVLGLTASCARCHDHKFDPIPTADYYALAGIFRSTELCAGVRNKMGGGGLDYYDPQMLVVLRPPAATDPKKIETAKKAAADARKEFERLRNSAEGDVVGPDGRSKRAAARQRFNRLQLALLELTDPAANGGQVTFGVRDAKSVADTEIRIRGEAEKLGPIVPRGFLSLLNVPGHSAVNGKQSGRLELAEWLTSASNPLTPRVLVNRVWKHLFGQALVSTVDNFGSSGDVPSHPELLDHLALRFVNDGWSVKRLIRSVVLSRAYRLGSGVSQANLNVDPANRLVWRHSPRRLQAEEIRDAMLASAGSLDLSRPTASPARDLKVVELPNNGPLARRIAEQARASRHRSVYLPLLRGLTPTSLEVFDAAEQGMVTGSRDTTTVAPQALYLLNDAFVRRQSLNLAERLLQKSRLDDESRVELAYRLTLGRPARASEVNRAKSFLAEYRSALRDVIAAGPEPGQVAFVKGKVSEPRRNGGESRDAAGSSTSLSAAEDAETPAKGRAKTAARKPAAPLVPDQVIPVDAPIKEEIIVPRNAKVAAWAAFCQALLGSAEFRYVE